MVSVSMQLHSVCATQICHQMLPKKTVPCIPLKRLGEASEIADAIRYLLSNQSSYVCGANIRIAGGRPMGSVNKKRPFVFTAVY